MIDFPVTIQLFGNDILLHTILESVGIFIGMRYYYYLKRNSHEKISLTVSLSILLGVTAGAFLGSKLIGNLEDPFLLFSGKMSLEEIWHSNTIVGGLAFGLLGTEIAKKLVHHRASTGDLMVYPLLLAMIIGRIGCFTMGVYEETYGIETDFILGMYLGDSVLRHPVSLYEICFLILLTIGLTYVKRNVIYPSGFLFQLFMLNYFLFRFFLDFIKPRVEIVGPLGTIQLVCLVMIFYYIYKISNSLSETKDKLVTK